MKTIKLKIKIRKSNKAVQTFIQQTFKNYQNMKKKLKKIWAIALLLVMCSIQTACNVTRVITNQSEYYQKGDTAVTIQTKTIETYNAQKNL